MVFIGLPLKPHPPLKWVSLGNSRITGSEAPGSHLRALVQGDPTQCVTRGGSVSGGVCELQPLVSKTGERGFRKRWFTAPRVLWGFLNSHPDISPAELLQHLLLGVSKPQRCPQQPSGPPFSTGFGAALVGREADFLCLQGDLVRYSAGAR